MRTLIVEDHPLYIESLRSVLEASDSSDELVAVTSCEEALELDEGAAFDLALFDFYLTGMSGIEALTALKRHFPDARIVMMSSDPHPQIILEAIEHGASGFIPKIEEKDVFIAALKLVRAGGVYLPPIALAASPAGQSLNPNEQPKAKNPIDALSPRQAEVLMKAIEGKPNKVIARELDIAEGTVKAHLSSALRAFGVKNRTEAVFLAAKAGWRSAG